LFDIVFSSLTPTEDSANSATWALSGVTTLITLRVAGSTLFTPLELCCKRTYREGEKVLFLAADINPRSRVIERRAEYDRLRTTLISPQATAKQVGVHIRPAINWNQGVRKFGRERIHVNGRVARYKYDVPKLHERRAHLARIDR
jgi:hypothetical protein